MKHNSLAVAIAIGLLVAGCGGGGGGGSSGTPSTPTTPDTPTTPTTPTVPSTSIPVVAGVATLSENRANYSLVRSTNGIRVTDLLTDRVRTVSGANAIRFADVTINLGIGDKSAALDAATLKSLIELYMAFNSRVPEANTLGFWIDQAAAGQTLAQLAERLYADAILVPEVSGYGATMANAEFVAAVYKNAFGRHGDTAPSSVDIAAWSDRIAKGGISRAALVIEMIAAARTTPTDLASASILQLLDNKAEVGEYVAVRQGVNYNTAAESIARTKAIAATVTPIDTVAARALLGFSDPAFNLKP